MPLSRPQIVAHRGASGLLPENTMAAFREAIRLGADGIELDAQLTADGAVAVHHDLRLNPALTREDGRWLDGPGPAVASLTRAILDRYDVGRVRPGSLYGRRYPDYTPVDGEPIPTLDRVIALVKANAPASFRLWIELKVEPGTADSSDPFALADAVLTLLRREDLVGRAVVLSFFWPALLRLHAAEPALALGFSSIERPHKNTIRSRSPGASPWTGGLRLRDHGGSLPRAIAASGGRWWIAHLPDVTPRRREQARAEGIGLAVWTVRRRRQLARVATLAPEAILTDRPDWWR